MLLLVQIIIVLAAIVLGARLGSIGIGLSGGLGVLLLGATGMQVSLSDIPFEVIAIIMAVISAIAAMQAAGGMDYLIMKAEKLLRSHPRRITFYAPIVTYFMTFFSGTGHTAFSTLPVIAEVAKEGGVRPSRPLSIAVVASQIAILASPISAAVVYVSSETEKVGLGYLQLLAIIVPSTFIAVLISAFVANKLGKELEDDPIYKERRAKGLVSSIKGSTETEVKIYAQRSLYIFLIAICIVLAYCIVTSSQLGLVSAAPIPRTEAILCVMLSTATLIILLCKIDSSDILKMPTFRSGMSACICVMGVAWLGTTLINNELDRIKEIAGSTLEAQPWLIALVFFCVAPLLYSQAATAKALVPIAIAVNTNPAMIAAALPATGALFILPTYPTLLAAVEMDDTGSTRIGKYVFNHSFIIPGILTIVLSVLIGIALAGVVA